MPRRTRSTKQSYGDGGYLLFNNEFARWLRANLAPVVNTAVLSPTRWTSATCHRLRIKVPRWVRPTVTPSRPRLPRTGG